MKTTCLLLMKQKLYALDAFFIEKLKLSENDPYMSLLGSVHCYVKLTFYSLTIGGQCCDTDNTLQTAHVLD